MDPTTIDESEKPPNVSNITDLTTPTVGDKQSHKCTSCSKSFVVPSDTRFLGKIAGLSLEWFIAAHRGDSDALRRLLAGDRDLLNSIDNGRQRVTALHTATWAGNQRCVEFLLSMNVDVNSQIVCNTILIMFSIPLL
ncbi:hypothetical protein Pelo_16958 [Pelomyxa schiedti]|nr:hypothetical protein Pelo_16958 [Pelomyxa schiedti]